MATDRIGLDGLIPLGFQKITLANSTAVGLNGTARIGAHVLDISVETQPARYRADGTDPTLTTGVILQKDTYIRLHGFNGTSVLKFQRTTGTVIVSVQSYKYD
jgi:hypothetical protein